MAHPEADNTRDRLLAQAEQLFAQKGFAAVTVREITAAADTNLAAVNYHFGNKMNLYLAVFRERWVPRALAVITFFKNRMRETPLPDAADMVRAFATAFLEGPMTDAEMRCHINLMLRELTHPSEAVDMVVQEVIRPMHRELRELMGASLPEHVPPERLSLSVFSMISMILYFGFAQPVVSRVLNQAIDQGFKTRIIDHIVWFAMDGIHGLSKENSP